MGKKDKLKPSAADGDNGIDTDVADEEAEDLPCKTHVKQYVRHAKLKKVLPHAAVACEGCGPKENDKAKTKGAAKKKQATALHPEEVQGLCVCLTCGHVACDEAGQHALGHNKSSRHPLAVNLATMEVWCYVCEAAADPDIYDDVQQAISDVSKALNLAGAGKKKATVVAEPAKTQGKAKRGARDGGAGAAMGAIPKAANVKGLVNLGNTCFFNSVMQVMARTGLLLECMDCPVKKRSGADSETAKTLLSQAVSKETGRLNIDGGLEPLTAALRGFLWKMTSATGGVVNPENLFNNVVKKAPRFSGYQQQDSHELLRYLLDNLRTEETKRRRHALLQHFDIDQNLDPSKLDANFRTRIKAAGDELASSTFVDFIFGGEFVSTVVCSDCNQLSWTTEPFLDMSLPIPGEIEHLEAVSGDSIRPSKLSKHQLKRAQKEARKKSHRKHGKAAAVSAADDGRPDSAVDAGKASGEDNSGDELDQLADAMGRLSCSSGTDGEADESAGDGSDGDKSDGEDRGSEGDDREYVLVGDGKAGAQDSDGHDSGIDGEGEAGSWEDAAKEVYETGQTPAASEPREVDAPMVGSEKETEASVSEEGATWEDAYNGDDDDGDGEKDAWSQYVSDPTRGEEFTHGTLKTWDELPSEFSVLSCLAKLCQKEELTGENRYRCGYCNKGSQYSGSYVYCDATKQLLVRQLPRVLVLHLKRFEQVGHTGAIRKVARHVPFRTELDIAPFCSAACKMPDGSPAQAAGTKYRLFGVVEHMGNLKSGHYVAYVRTGDDSWAYTSDSQTQAVAQEKVLGAQASLLCYEQIQ